jgi:predicted MFS family arabinose efflux permease
LNLSYSMAGFHMSAFAVGMTLAGLTGDRLAQTWGRRAIFWVGAFGMAVGAVGLTWAGQAGLTIISAGVMGFLGSLLLVMVQATLAERHGEQRTIALTESNVGASISASLAPLFVGSFQRVELGWRGALFLAIITLAFIALRFGQTPVPELKPPTLPSSSVKRGLPPSFWAYWLVVFLGVSIEWGLIFWGADFLEKVVGLSRINAATMMSVFFGAMILGRIAGSRLSRNLPNTTLLMSAILITVAGFPLFWLARWAPLNIAGLFLAGFGVANLFPLTLATAISIAPHQVDAASVRISAAGGLAILITPFILGWVADQLNIQNAYGIVGLLALVATAVTFIANRMASNRPAPILGRLPKV